VLVQRIMKQAYVRTPTGYELYNAWLPHKCKG
jgi:hypothetical protein